MQKITKEFLLEAGFVETISFELRISKDKAISVTHNDLDDWYLGFRNVNSGQDDNFVIIRADLKYESDLLLFIHSIGAYSPIFDYHPIGL